MAQRYPSNVARRAAAATSAGFRGRSSGSVPRSTPLTHSMRASDPAALLGQAIAESSGSVLDRAIAETRAQAARAAAWGRTRVPPEVLRAARRMLPIAARLHPAMRAVDLAGMLIQELLDAYNERLMHGETRGLEHGGYVRVAACNNVTGPQYAHQATGTGGVNSTWVALTNTCAPSSSLDPPTGRLGPWPDSDYAYGTTNLRRNWSTGSGYRWYDYWHRAPADRFRQFQKPLRAGTGTRGSQRPWVGRGIMAGLGSAAGGPAGMPGVPAPMPGERTPNPRVRQRAVIAVRQLIRAGHPLITREVGPSVSEQRRAAERPRAVDSGRPYPVAAPSPIDPATGEAMDEVEVVVGGPSLATRAAPVRIRPSRHRYRTTYRERKVRIGGSVAVVYRVLGAFFGRLTEVGDFIDALHRALPEHHRKPRADSRGMKRWQWQLEDLYRGWRELDVAKAVGNVVADQIEDALIGRLSRLGNQIGWDAWGPRAAPVYGLGTRILKPYRPELGTNQTLADFSPTQPISAVADMIGSEITRQIRASESDFAKRRSAYGV